MLRSVENSRRELASRVYDEYPSRSGSFDTALFGYARVSTAEQNPDHQVDALVHAGVAAKDIYVDHASGAKASRPALDTVLRMLRDGDTLKITRLDRLGRSVLHLVTLGAELRERGVGLHVTEQGIDTTTGEGRAPVDEQPRRSRATRRAPTSFRFDFKQGLPAVGRRLNDSPVRGASGGTRPARIRPKSHERTGRSSTGRGVPSLSRRDQPLSGSRADRCHRSVQPHENPHHTKALRSCRTAVE
jgi:hypothetical protein